jgi:hypothetical protein
MEEIRHIISHLFGMCGDAHPNILSLFLGNAEFLNYLQYIIKYKIK